ncbi:hypothetical protein CRX72_12905 [Pantoea sp. BRM17]|nr:hypothetical protein CRX72_12905 [Pantoea sp. BRM17]
MGMGAADASRRNFLALSRLSGDFYDRLRGRDTLRLFHRAAAEKQAIAASTDSFRQRTMEVLRLAFLRPAGSWSTLLLEQIEQLQEYYARYLPQMTLAVAIPCAILVAVFPVNWAAGLILLVTAPLIPLFMAL